MTPNPFTGACEVTDQFLKHPNQDQLARVVAHSQWCRPCKKKLVQADPPLEALCFDLEYQQEIDAVLQIFDSAARQSQVAAPPASKKERTPTMADAPVLEGYRIVELLGHGGSGTVWKAYQKILGRFIAIKIMNQSDGKKIYERLAKESKILSSLRHPNSTAAL